MAVKSRSGEMMQDTIKGSELQLTSVLCSWYFDLFLACTSTPSVIHAKIGKGPAHISI